MACITPEMAGKIIDESHFDFHVTCKAKLVNAVNKMKAGGDLLKTLAGLKFKTDPRWIKNSCNDPSVAAMLEILEEYKKNEKRPTRARMLAPLLEYAIGLYASDLFFRERGSWFICKLIEKQNSFVVCKIFEDPKCWYPNTRNLDGVVGPTGNFYISENDPERLEIEDEYKVWYGVDVTADKIEITDEVKKKVISENIEWCNTYSPEVYGLMAAKK